MLKSQQSHLKLAMQQIEKQHEERLKNHAQSFEYEVTKIHDVAKEYYAIFVEQVKKVEEFVNLKVDKLKSKMPKKVDKLKKNYSTLHGMVNVIVDMITKLVVYHNSFSPKLDTNTDQDLKVFKKLEEFLESLKEYVLKIDLLH
ncbi:unnamed protein product [Lactuca saligna]|uniref:Uncharacterized protein n=1 Tax=Lactuca saligna TaxID=75948 RepID=A0AA36E843_LACSI|nr:unnamed protein product [Lactuca saligna]